MVYLDRNIYKDFL